MEKRKEERGKSRESVCDLLKKNRKTCPPPNTSRKVENSPAYGGCEAGFFALLEALGAVAFLVVEEVVFFFVAVVEAAGFAVFFGLFGLVEGIS